MIEFPAYLLAPDDSHPLTLTPAYSCSESDLGGSKNCAPARLVDALLELGQCFVKELVCSGMIICINGGRFRGGSLGGRNSSNGLRRYNCLFVFGNFSTCSLTSLARVGDQGCRSQSKRRRISASEGIPSVKSCFNCLICGRVSIMASNERAGGEGAGIAAGGGVASTTGVCTTG
jgi:hypothetical protein